MAVKVLLLVGFENVIVQAVVRAHLEPNIAVCRSVSIFLHHSVENHDVREERNPQYDCSRPRNV